MLCVQKTTNNLTNLPPFHIWQKSDSFSQRQTKKITIATRKRGPSRCSSCFERQKQQAGSYRSGRSVVSFFWVTVKVALWSPSDQKSLDKRALSMPVAGPRNV